MAVPKFYLERRKEKKTGILITKNLPIRLSYCFDGKRLEYYTGFRVDTFQWDSENQKVKRNNFNKQEKSASEINSHLNKIETILDDTYQYYKVNKKYLSVDDLRKELIEKLNPVCAEKKEKNFFDLFQDFIDAEEVTWAINTKKRVVNSMNHLKAYNKNLTFKDINEDFFQKFINYSITKKNHQNATILKQIKNTKLFLNWATRKKLNNNLDYKNYQPTRKLKGAKNVDDKNITFLTWEELIHLYNLEIDQTYLKQVRDIFCFCCFTGLRYSDVLNLKHGNIINDFIKFTTVKTDDTLNIPLNKYSRAILDKYKDIEFENDRCLPVISNQKMNDYLKIIGEKAGCDSIQTLVTYQGSERSEKSYKKYELLSTHVARKTFIVNAITLEIPIPVIMSLSGHSSFEAMKPYIKIVDTLKQREMNKFDK